LENKSKFVSLKLIVPILSFILLTTIQASSQESRNPLPTLPDGGSVKVLKLYPNPATSYVTFDIQKSYQKGLTISVFNMLGKKVAETQNVNEKTNLPVTDFNRGMYIYHLTDNTGKVIDTGKFQVSR
jgi:Secretion system C-terminal sorting domain